MSVTDMFNEYVA